MGFETTLSKHYKKDRTFYKVQSFSLVFLASNLSCATTKYSGLTLNQYGVASPCRTICTVCGFVALS